MTSLFQMLIRHSRQFGHEIYALRFLHFFLVPPFFFNWERTLRPVVNHHTNSNRDANSRHPTNRLQHLLFGSYHSLEERHQWRTKVFIKLMASKAVIVFCVFDTTTATKFNHLAIEKIQHLVSQPASHRASGVVIQSPPTSESDDCTQSHQPRPKGVTRTTTNQLKNCIKTDRKPKSSSWVCLVAAFSVTQNIVKCSSQCCMVTDVHLYMVYTAWR